MSRAGNAADDDGDGDVVNIKAFFVHVHVRPFASFNDPFPQFLTLLFPPPNPTLSLRRLLNHPHAHLIFGATLSLRPIQALSFYLCFGDAKLLKGVFIKQDHYWRLECKSLLRHSHLISEAQLCFALHDGNLAISHWVSFTHPKDKIIKHCIRGWQLEQIPEEIEVQFSDSDTESNNPDTQQFMDLDLQRIRWAVDLGIWVLCLGLGVGYLVSKASVRKFRPS